MTGSRPVSIGNERDALDCFAPPASHTSLLTSPSPSFAAHRHGIMQRRRSGSSPSRPTFALRSTPRRDLWSALTRTLAPCIQRLVSCGMIKSDVARDLLTLPDRFHPRTPRQTVAVLRGRSGEWEIEYAAGLSDALGAGSSTPRAAASNQEAKLPTLEETLTLVHPACKALQAGQMGAKIYAEHCIQVRFRSFLSSSPDVAR